MCLPKGDVFHGMTVLHCLTDNGIFAEFQDGLSNSKQGLTLSGVGAHHQHAVAEREFGVVFNLARTMMLHVKLPCLNGCQCQALLQLILPIIATTLDLFDTSFQA